jgi:hypothetical protein
LTAPTRLVTQTNWVVMGCAAIRNSFLLSARKVRVGVRRKVLRKDFVFRRSTIKRAVFALRFFERGTFTARADAAPRIDVPGDLHPSERSAKPN